MSVLYEVIPYTEKEKWGKVLASFSTKDIFSLPAYCHLYPALGDGDPYLFIFKDGKGHQVYYVFFKREIHTLPFAQQERSDEKLYDIITPLIWLWWSII